MFVRFLQILCKVINFIKTYLKKIIHKWYIFRFILHNNWYRVIHRKFVLLPVFILYFISLLIKFSVDRHGFHTPKSQEQSIKYLGSYSTKYIKSTHAHESMCVCLFLFIYTCTHMLKQAYFMYSHASFPKTNLLKFNNLWQAVIESFKYYVT